MEDFGYLLSLYIDLILMVLGVSIQSALIEATVHITLGGKQRCLETSHVVVDTLSRSPLLLPFPQILNLWRAFVG